MKGAGVLALKRKIQYWFHRRTEIHMIQNIPGKTFHIKSTADNDPTKKQMWRPAFLTYLLYKQNTFVLPRRAALTRLYYARQVVVAGITYTGKKLVFKNHQTMGGVQGLAPAVGGRRGTCFSHYFEPMFASLNIIIFIKL